MTDLPADLNAAIRQARAATQAALSDGYTRLQVELVFPDLKMMPVTQEFLPTFDSLGLQLKILFPDAGAAALARRDWDSDFPFPVEDLGNSRSPVTRRIDPGDQIFLVVEPSAVEVAQAETLCQVAADRPVILLNPHLEDAATIGIGYAGRQLRDRFLSTLESCYYLRPLPEGALFRCYPSPWQVWRETREAFELLEETAQKPTGEAIEQLFRGEPEARVALGFPGRSKPGLLAGLDRFLRALSR